MNGVALLKRIAFGLFLAWMPAFPTWAQDVQPGAAAYQRGDFSLALDQWRPMARNGDPEAQYGLAVLYAKGQGVDKNPALAITWYRKAALQGHGAAQFNLGRIYGTGEGVARDQGEATKWFRMAARQVSTAE
jgi:hypothetical protein